MGKCQVKIDSTMKQITGNLSIMHVVVSIMTEVTKKMVKNNNQRKQYENINRGLFFFNHKEEMNIFVGYWFAKILINAILKNPDIGGF
jgi:predicted RNA-binding protein (virulence factor B family)